MAIQEVYGNGILRLQPRFATAVVKSDSTVLEESTLYVGTAGDVSVVTAGGSTAVFKNVANGSILPVRIIKVLDATTATDMLILA